MEVKDEMIVNMDNVPILRTVKQRIESKYGVRLVLGLISNDPDGSRKQWIEFVGQNQLSVKLAKEYTKALCNPEGSLMMPYEADLHRILTCTPVHNRFEDKFDAAVIFTEQHMANIMGSELGVVMASSALDDLSAKCHTSHTQTSEESSRLGRQFALKLENYRSPDKDLVIHIFNSIPLGAQMIIIEWLEFDSGRGMGDQPVMAAGDIIDMDSVDGMHVQGFDITDSPVINHSAGTRDPDQTSVMRAPLAPTSDMNSSNVRSRTQVTSDTGNSSDARDQTNISDNGIQPMVSVHVSEASGSSSEVSAPTMCSDQNIPIPAHYLSLLTTLSYTEQEVREVIQEKGTQLRVAELIKALSDVRKAKASGQTQSQSSHLTHLHAIVTSPPLTQSQSNPITSVARGSETLHDNDVVMIEDSAQTFDKTMHSRAGMRDMSAGNFCMATGDNPGVKATSHNVTRDMPGSNGFSHQGSARIKYASDFIVIDPEEVSATDCVRDRQQRVNSGDVELLAEHLGQEHFTHDFHESQPKHRKQETNSELPAFQLYEGHLEFDRGGSHKHKASESPLRNKKNKKKKKVKATQHLNQAKGVSSQQDKPAMEDEVVVEDDDDDDADIIHIPQQQRYDRRDPGRNGAASSPRQIGDPVSPRDKSQWVSGESRDAAVEERTLPTSSVAAGKDVPLRCIVIDGSNVAFTHGKKQGQYFFSWPGIQIAVDYFKSRGHTEIMVFAPQHFKSTARAEDPEKAEAIWKTLEGKGMLTFTPSRKIQGKRQTCYDDRFIVQYAFGKDGVIVSNDNYRDLMEEREEWRTFIEQRLLMYAFAGDMFMPPNDPFGRDGPTLDQLLMKLNPEEMERLMRERHRAQSPPRPIGGRGQGQRGQRSQQGQRRTAQSPVRKARSEEKSKQLFRELRGIVPDSDDKIHAVLRNHPFDTDLNRLVGHLLDAMQ